MFNCPLVPTQFFFLFFYPPQSPLFYQPQLHFFLLFLVFSTSSTNLSILLFTHPHPVQFLSYLPSPPQPILISLSSSSTISYLSYTILIYVFFHPLPFHFSLLFINLFIPFNSVPHFLLTVSFLFILLFFQLQ